ncbi:BMP family ABC transporter substrate-binding protein [Actinomyces sp. zg-332]|uniref:BMP family ABC transporter substrate-binding protein n=1 Tax=Actinomyces sp. zg-332 TaxID=2708340 RepID=UPI001423426A|nr:BMP family ABC transporter substrate-binding protein [Actinomyces sp. zg-332]QPK93970.1 BMP family ABC transporter substrate-binding protein [Actinomyces sp. zg-332]
MNSLKKVIVGATTLSLFLAGCASSSSDNNAAIKVEKKACVMLQTSQSLDYEQNKILVEETAKTVAKINSKKKDSVKVYSFGKNDYKEKIDGAIKEKCDTIMGIGKPVVDLLSFFATQNPEITFISMGTKFVSKLENTKEINISLEESGFLAGYLSAGMTRTGKIATFTDTQSSISETYMDGIRKGIAKYNADNGTGITLVGLNKENEDSKNSSDKKDSKNNDNKGNRKPLLLKENNTEEIKKLVSTLVSDKADILLPVLQKNQEVVLQEISNTPNTSMFWMGQDFTEIKDNQKLVLAMTTVKISHFIQAVVTNTNMGEKIVSDIATNLQNEGLKFKVNPELEKDIPAFLTDEINKIMESLSKGKKLITT